MAGTRCSASPSPGSQATQASMPHGSAWLARMAWPSKVDFPKPAPATTVVKGTENRRAICSSRRARVSSSCRAGGGAGARRPPRGRASSRISPRRYASCDVAVSNRYGGRRRTRRRNSPRVIAQPSLDAPAWPRRCRVWTAKRVRRHDGRPGGRRVVDGGSPSVLADGGDAVVEVRSSPSHDEPRPLPERYPAPALHCPDDTRVVRSFGAARGASRGERESS